MVFSSHVILPVSVYSRIEQVQVFQVIVDSANEVVRFTLLSIALHPPVSEASVWHHVRLTAYHHITARTETLLHIVLLVVVVTICRAIVAVSTRLIPVAVSVEPGRVSACVSMTAKSGRASLPGISPTRVMQTGFIAE